MMAAMRSRTTPRWLRNQNERAKRASLRQRQNSQSSLSKPLWILVGPVEVVARFVPFELAVPRGLRGSCQECISFRGSERFKRSRRVESLLQIIHRFAARDDHAGPQVHGVVEAFHP